MNRQTELGVIWGGKGSEKLQMIQALQAEVEGIKREIAGLHASILAADQWEAKMHGMQAQMTDSIKEMKRVEKIFNVPFIMDMQETMDTSKQAVARMEASMREKCSRDYMSKEIELVSTVLRREIFEFYEQRPNIVTATSKTESGKAPKHRPRSLEAELRMLIRRSCDDTARTLERSHAHTEHRLDDKIDQNQKNVRIAALHLSNSFQYLNGRVTEIEKAMGMKAPSKHRMLPAPPAGQELHDAIEKLQAQPPEELGAWTKPSTTPSEFSTLMGMINDTNLLVQKIYYDLDLVKTAMTDMDDRLHSVETALQPKP
jgi:hypothetical protein